MKPELSINPKVLKNFRDIVPQYSSRLHSYKKCELSNTNKLFGYNIE